ncbi:MAG: hypothetical protein ACI4KR_10440 [Ruminiclostridium sp.]
MKILKIIIILAVGAVSLFGAIYFTGSYVAEVNERDKTLAEIIMQNQLEAELNKAEEQAKQELGDALVTTVMETKPVIKETTPPETAPPVTTTTATNTTTTTTTPVITETEPIEEEIITEFTRGGILPDSSDGIGIKTIFTLTPDEQNRLTRFLIDHYFLDGDVYVGNETRAELKEKKAVANLMEKSAIAALNLVVAGIDTSDISSIMTADYDKIYDEITAIRDSFREEYKDSEKYGENYVNLYNESLKVLDRMIEAVNKLKKSSSEYKNSTNQLLAALVLAKALDEVVIPEVTAVLEQSFDLVEITQEIFLEGTQGTRLLSRDEVSAIIANPALILDSGLA